MHTGD